MAVIPMLSHATVSGGIAMPSDLAAQNENTPNVAICIVEKEYGS